MSGGYWNYEQERMKNFGEELMADRDPTIAAAGAHIAALGEVLHDFDWMRSADRSTDGWDDACQKMEALLGKQAVVDVVTTRLEFAVNRLSKVLAK